jgi:hypothetical protein
VNEPLQAQRALRRGRGEKRREEKRREEKRVFIYRLIFLGR